MKRAAGFTLIELLVVILLIGFVLMATSNTFVGLLSGYKQQGKITETNIAGIISLEMLRRDIKSAGYGLPWVIPSTATAGYTGEAVNATANAYNDYPTTTNPPRAVLSGLNADGSAYLVLKGMNLAHNAACTKWVLLPPDSLPLEWISSTPTHDNFLDTERVVLISPGSDDSNFKTLVATGPYSAIRTQSVPNETRIIYGVDDADLRMPFNRADYYLNTTGSVRIPGRCAPGTGVLVKSTINQLGGALNSQPLLDCVADMQVVTNLDMDNNGEADTLSTGFWVAPGATAAQTIRDQLKEVRVYILAHEGQRDTSYTHSLDTVLVGEMEGATVYGRNFDLTAITDWQNYRWKIYSLVVRPGSLR